ncbi:MAG: type II toxin-antitoxin system VapB family antitoxin [Burkholderiales bacterium]|nr:type II toxin-antitoxin system VapB family antitoxin [Burkholderiales bacterium]
MIDAITQALRERLSRLRSERQAQGDYVARVQAFVHDHVHWFDRRPITKREWDEAVGDTQASVLRVRR